ncbi:MAG: hypothetical protein ACOC24_04055 [Desulfovibrionales bacterium]
MARPTSKKFQKTVEEVFEIFMFEHWLRFYFVKEKDSVLSVEIPDKALDKIREEYPALAPLAEALNGEVISPEVCQRKICEHISITVEQRQTDSEMVPSVLNSPRMNQEIFVFNLWVEGHEEQLDSRFLDFASWKEIYLKWKSTDEAREFINRLVQTPGESGCAH